MTEEFEHYFRICLNRELTSEEAKAYIFAVSEIVPVIATDEEVAMIYHIENGAHCYDVNLENDVSGAEGDQIFTILENLFEDDEFELESSMDTVSEQLYLNRALLEQLNQKL